MAMTLQLVDLLDMYESYVERHGHDDSARVQESIDDMARDIVTELRELRPVIESNEFVGLLDRFAGKL